MSRALTVLLVVSLTVSSLAADPAAALAEGKQAIQNREYARAIRVLQDAVPDAANLAGTERNRALAALHFFTAIAFNAMRDDAKTREELEQFFEFSPETNRIDPAKYDGRFVRHFNEVRKLVEGSGGAAFDAAYPGYRTFSDRAPRERPLDQWGDGPELTLFGSSDEKQEWRRLRDDAARRRFIEEFWQRRDTTPSTAENEFRTDILRRVAFADHTFVTERTRGSLTDRGRAFVLLGPPRVVRQTNLSGADAANTIDKRGPVSALPTSGPASEQLASVIAAEASNRRLAAQSSGPPAVRGKTERWIYGRDQLPKGFPDDHLTLKFITQHGYGENVLQRDPLVVKALMDAGRARQ